MSNTADLRSIPLFHDLKEEQAGDLLRVFKKEVHKAGHVLFTSGEVPTRVLVLSKGEVSLAEEGATKFTVHATSMIGELGSLTGIPRSTTATANTNIEVLSVDSSELLAYFEKHGNIGFAFYRNLLGVVSDKVRRDRRRLFETRANLIRTQKAMKQLRELVLASAENELSKPIFEVLDEHIEKNRRVHYRVSPTLGYPANVRLDDGKLLRVLEVSDGYLKLEGTAAQLTKDPSYYAAVLVLPTAEVLVSGSVVRDGKDGVVVKLDQLVDEHKQRLDDFTTQLQLLDFVV